MAEEPKRLYRSRNERRIAGVLGGIAEYFNLDPSLVRVAYVVLTVFTLILPGSLLYLAMAVIVPETPD
ncbi:MAG: PspC domain-containing protein [Dehalococcoidia bacterium]|nr:PspC domain-containing protein [Dehalococcoidia bacterium]MDZ4278891.1 PspC domain-containing protein [Dehalococcoidia bacterium]